MTANTPVSLPTLLSHVLVAYTIEFDNEFEHQMPHRTTHYGATPGASHADTPWLVSLAMYANCMQHIGEKGLTVAELERLARTKTNLDGMRRWGYVIIEPNPPRPSSRIRPTPAGRKAQEVWQPLFSVIEQRWQRRFGSAQIDSLRQSLSALADQLGLNLPDCLPILHHGLFSRESDHLPEAPPEAIRTADLPLSALLSRVLLAFALEFERESELSLAISANIIRLLDEKGMLIRDLRLLAGISKEAVSMATGYLEDRSVGMVELAPSAGSSKLIRLTPKGQTAQNSYHYRIGVIERRWQARFGKDRILALKDSLAALDDAPAGQRSLLFGGLEPYPDGWRASVGKPDVLPDYPMVLHRGGFPDGS